MRGKIYKASPYAKFALPEFVIHTTSPLSATIYFSCVLLLFFLFFLESSASQSVSKISNWTENKWQHTSRTTWKLCLLALCLQPTAKNDPLLDLPHV